MNELTQELLKRTDRGYRDFTAALIPTVPKERIIGVRTPEIRRLARSVYTHAEAKEFIASLPHCYYEENNLHAFLVEQIKDYDTAITETERFLPYIDNWSTCDCFNPKVFAKHTDRLYEKTAEWLGSGHTYTVRYGIRMLMKYFLDDEYTHEISDRVAAVRSEEYYIKMMCAWFFAEVLVKQYGSALPYFENKALEPWTHNKAIQKACESRRISAECKEYLKSLKY
ncbi:MAG: DNA alkylation repair protein [Clostridia bacterium]|nr:DNA alkylation repair protein [Clostridia bacterium]MDY3784836.1 DNA alkylation repair protein [Eubacteriales bacterium]